MKRLFAETALFLVLVFLCPDCTQPSRRQVNTVLDDVESYINDRPDSALAVLEGVDSTALTTRALRARYSLLRTMAQAKNYRDLTVPGLIDDAAAWYARHGSADEKMNTLYYQGCIAQANGDQKNAVVYFARAEELVGKTQDAHAVGLLYEAMASVYNNVYNTDKEQEYIEKALMTFKEAGDPMYKSALGGLALVYHTRRDWAKADSLYQEAIANSEAYPHAMTVFLSNYARMKLLQPDKDPSGAIQLLNKKRVLSEGEMVPVEVGAYAYASALKGDQQTCNVLSSRLLDLSRENRKPALPWLYRIALYKDDQARALELLQEMRFQEDGEINAILSESVTKALQDYYEESARQERERRLRLGVWTLAGVSLLLFIAILLLLRERRVRAERDRLLRIRAELEQDLKEQEARTSMLSDSFSSRLAQLRLQLKVERLERLRKSGQYGYWIWMEKKGRSSDANVTKALRKDLQDICALEKDSRLLECRLDKELDGIVSHLKADLNIANRPKEVFFLCCWLIGLKPDMIAELLNLQMSNVYVKTHRLEERIRRLGKAEYAPLVKE